MSGAGLPCSTSSPAIVVSKRQAGAGERAVQALAHRGGRDGDPDAAGAQLLDGRSCVLEDLEPGVDQRVEVLGHGGPGGGGVGERGALRRGSA